MLPSPLDGYTGPHNAKRRPPPVRGVCHALNLLIPFALDLSLLQLVQLRFFTLPEHLLNGLERVEQIAVDFLAADEH